jgi:hypothetical protein
MLKFTIGVAVDPEEAARGLDLHEHGARAYVTENSRLPSKFNLSYTAEVEPPATSTTATIGLKEMNAV